MSTVRVRFAPSPTGYLHVGGARTALFNWLFARGAGGEFLLRIEDTDVARSSAEMVTSILDSMRWLGLDWDGDPTFQSSGLERYRQLARELVEKGHAYPCFCRPEDVGDEGEEPEVEKTYLYPRTCLKLTPEERRKRIEGAEPYAIRFMVPPGATSFNDLVYGKVSVEHTNIDDFVLLRRDGNPTYQLAVVADDIMMGISHVIRGDDHLSNTPKQILLYQALEKAPPEFAHLPLILGPDKKRLSKRHGATSITSYREMGFLPQAVVNFLALLGWSPGDDVEVLSMESLKARFSLERVTKKSAVFDLKKLEWLNGKYISMSPAEDLLLEVSQCWKHAGLVSETELSEKREWLLSLIDLLKSRARLLGDFVEAARPFLTEDFPYEEEAVRKRWQDSGEIITVLEGVAKGFSGLPDFSMSAAEEVVKGIAERLGIPNAQVIHPLRVALTGRAGGPGLFELIVVIGREGCLARLGRALRFLRERPGEGQNHQASHIDKGSRQDLN
jgi:glutamyl-tRNA synthetase